MILRHIITGGEVTPGAIVTSRDQQQFTLAKFDEEFVYAIPKGKRTSTERYRPQFFSLEVITEKEAA